GRAARQPHLSAAGCRRADPRGPLDFGRARLSRRRAGALLPARYEARHLRTDHRQRGARGVPALHPAGGYHPGARIGARAGAADENRTRDGQGRDHRALPLRPRRQGCRKRRQISGDGVVSTRLADRFAACAAAGRPALVTFVMAGDPDLATGQAILAALPGAGADVVELDMALSDPMADGPGIQAAGQRALKAGQTLKRTLGMVAEFRRTDTATPVVLMGYYNPIYSFGPDKFVREALAAGVDGLIIVDLPPEEDAELCLPALAAGLNFIRLTTPTTDDRRLPTVLENSSGFVYYVSMTGITGAAIKSHAAVGAAVQRIKAHTALPVAVGFGIKTG